MAVETQRLEEHVNIGTAGIQDGYVLEWSAERRRWLAVGVEPQTYLHEDLTDVTEDQHHPKLHDLDSHTDVNSVPAADGMRLAWDEANGVWVPKRSTSALAIVAFQYRFSTSTDTTPNPGRVQLNNSNQPLSTIMYINEEDNDGEDIVLWLENIKEGAWINLYDRDDSSHHISFTATGVSTRVADVFHVPIAFFDSEGGDLNNNLAISLFIRYVPVDPPPGLPPGGDTDDHLTKVSADDYDTVWSPLGAWFQDQQSAGVASHAGTVAESGTDKAGVEADVSAAGVSSLALYGDVLPDGKITMASGYEPTVALDVLTAGDFGKGFLGDQIFGKHFLNPLTDAVDGAMLLSCMSRSQTTNSHLTGSVTFAVTGPGTVVSPNNICDGTGAYTTISGTDNTTTQIQITLDVGFIPANYGTNWRWQPYVMIRLVAGGLSTWYNNIVVEVSMNNSTWISPSNGAWTTTDFESDSTFGFWATGLAHNPGGSWRYARFTFTSRQEDPGYTFRDQVWISEVGIMHQLHEFAQQYVQVDSGTLYTPTLKSLPTSAGTTGSGALWCNGTDGIVRIS